uniref:EF-hand domain-containing protein n=2 Tax=Mucochytrium quahogii TaxID=96639 RepID=A0A7S2S8C4_9STRA
MAERVYGCCWKKVPGTDGQERPRRTCPFDNMQAEVQKRGLKLNPGDGELEVLNLFVAEFCEKTKLSEFISHENLYSLTHDTVQPGFKDAYLSFAAALGLNPKTIKLTPTLIEATGLSKRSVRIETIRNLRRIDRASNSARKQTFSFRWYAMLYLETTVHQVLFTVGPLMILQITLSIEFLQSSTLNPGIGLYAEDLLALHKRVSLPRISELLAVSVHGLLVISVVCNLLLALIYLELNNNPVVEKCVRMGYRLVYSVTLFVLFGFMMMQGIWVMLAAFLQPGHFLPFGASIVAFVGMVTAQYKKIHDVRTNLQKVFKEVFNENMKTQVVNMLNLHSQAKDAAKGAAKAFTDQADYEFDPNDLFTLVTSARTTVLVKEAQTSAMLPEEHNLLEPPHETTTPQEIMTREDFDMLFDILELEILPKKRDILFAYCDMEEGNGQVTRDEFLGAWGWLEEELTSSIIGQSLGLSNFQITVYIVTFAIVLVLMIIFLLNSVATFAVGGNFSSIIQSAAITALAKTSGELSNGFGAAANATNLQSEDTGKIVKGKVDEKLTVNIIMKLVGN